MGADSARKERTLRYRPRAVERVAALLTDPLLVTVARTVRFALVGCGIPFRAPHIVDVAVLAIAFAATT